GGLVRVGGAVYLVGMAEHPTGSGTATAALDRPARPGAAPPTRPDEPLVTIPRREYEALRAAKRQLDAYVDAYLEGGDDSEDATEALNRDPALRDRILASIAEANRIFGPGEPS